MRKLILLMVFMITSMVSYSQQKTFTIVDQGTVSTTEVTKYESAIQNSDMESYRNKTTRTVLVFDTGLKIELLSAQELYILGVNINPNDYVDSRDPKFTFPTFHLTPGGHLLAFYQSIGK